MVNLKQGLLGLTLVMALASVSCGIKGPPKPTKSAQYGVTGSVMPR
jgi:hypothetical protein